MDEIKLEIQLFVNSRNTAVLTIDDSLHKNRSERYFTNNADKEFIRGAVLEYINKYIPEDEHVEMPKFNTKSASKSETAAAGSNGKKKLNVNISKMIGNIAKRSKPVANV